MDFVLRFFVIFGARYYQYIFENYRLICDLKGRLVLFPYIRAPSWKGLNSIHHRGFLMDATADLWTIYALHLSDQVFQYDISMPVGIRS